MEKALLVVAGLLRHPLCDAVLLARRPQHKVRGGLWEFPGGKVDVDETPALALARELHEELGVRARIGPLRLRLEHRYPDLTVQLLLHEVLDWQGELQPLQVDALHWLNLEQLPARLPGTLSLADQQLLSRLQLPSLYRITPDCTGLSAADREHWLQGVSAQLRADPASRCLFRVPTLDAQARRALLEALLQTLPDPSQLLVSRDVALAHEFGLGVQLSAAQLDSVPEGCAGLRGPRAASCHDLAQLERAAQLGCDWVTLSPILPTRSHPRAPALGWQALQHNCAASTLPVYALGGLAPQDLQQARAHGAVGVAGISSFWTQAGWSNCDDSPSPDPLSVIIG